MVLPQANNYDNIDRSRRLSTTDTQDRSFSHKLDINLSCRSCWSKSYSCSCDLHWHRLRHSKSRFRRCRIAMISVVIGGKIRSSPLIPFINLSRKIFFFFFYFWFDTFIVSLHNFIKIDINGNRDTWNYYFVICKK